MESLAGFIVVIAAVALSIVLLIVISMWKIYEKANKPGWTGIIPFYNLYVLTEIIKKPWWWFLLMLIPYIGIIWHVGAIHLLVKKFGQSMGFTMGVIFLPFIFLPILAFSQTMIFIDDEETIESAF